MPSFRPKRKLRHFSDEQATELFGMLSEVSDNLQALSARDTSMVVNTGRVELRTNQFVRLSPPATGQVAVLPPPRRTTPGDLVVVSLEAPLGSLTVAVVPDRDETGRMVQGTVNGQPRVTFTLPGEITFRSNGADRWLTASQHPSEVTGGATPNDATYLLQTAHGSLPNARVGVDSTEISADYTVAGAVSWALRTASVVFAKLQDLTGLSVLGRAANSSGVMAAVTATAARQTLRNNDAGTALEWGHPVEIRNNANTDIGDVFSIRGLNGTHTTVSVGAVAAGATTFAWNVDVASLLAAIDSTSIVVSGSTLQTAAVTGAISKAQNATASLFAGIRDNGTPETARTFLNFVSTSLDTTFSLTQDALNDEIEVRVSTLGSFYAQNSGLTVQTKFISFDNGSDTLASRVDNTGTSGYINVSYTVNKGVGFSWTGNHDWSGSTFLVDVSSTATLRGLATIVQADGLASDLELLSGRDIEATAGRDLVFIAAEAVNITSNGDTTDRINITAAAGRVDLTALETVIDSSGSAGGFVRIKESSASTPSVPAGYGTYWFLNDAPSRGMYTDDTNVDRFIDTSTVRTPRGLVSSNTTVPTTGTGGTNLSIGGTYTVPASGWEAGMVLEFYGEYVLVETAVAKTITVELLVNGAVVESIAPPGAGAAGTRWGRLHGHIRCQTVGAGGTMVCSISGQNNHGGTEDQRMPQSTTTGTTALDTTLTRSVQMRIRASTLGAGNSLSVVQGYVRRL